MDHEQHVAIFDNGSKDSNVDGRYSSDNNFKIIERIHSKKAGMSLTLDAHEIVVQGFEIAAKRPKIWTYTNGILEPKIRSLVSQIRDPGGLVYEPNRKI